MVRGDFEDQIRRIDATLRRLNDLGIDLSLPGPALLASLRARKQQMQQQ